MSGVISEGMQIFSTAGGLPAPPPGSLHGHGRTLGVWSHGAHCKGRAAEQPLGPPALCPVNHEIISALEENKELELSLRIGSSCRSTHAPAAASPSHGAAFPSRGKHPWGAQPTGCATGHPGLSRCSPADETKGQEPSPGPLQAREPAEEPFRCCGARGGRPASPPPLPCPLRLGRAGPGRRLRSLRAVPKQRERGRRCLDAAHALSGWLGLGVCRTDLRFGEGGVKPSPAGLGSWRCAGSCGHPSGAG